MIYFGIVHSKVQYGITCWGGAYLNKVNPLLIAQKHIIRIICKKNRLYNSFVLFQELKILPIRHLYYYKVLKVFFIRSGYLTVRNNAIHNLRTNSNDYVNIPTHNKNHFRKFFTIVAPMIFNKLPDSIRRLRVLSLFIKKIKSWLLNLDYTEIENLLKLQT